MTTDKEELRKAAAKYSDDYDGMQWEKDRVEIAFIKGADWLYSKLEAKDKEMVELKSDKERLAKACNYIQSSRNELDKQITDLKAERDDLKMTLESSEKLRVIQQAEIEKLKAGVRLQFITKPNNL